jgi:hypothetical protein
METLYKIKEKFSNEWRDLVSDSGKFENDLFEFIAHHPDYSGEGLEDRSVHVIFDYLYRIANRPAPLWVIEYKKSLECWRIDKEEEAECARIEKEREDEYWRIRTEEAQKNYSRSTAEYVMNTELYSVIKENVENGLLFGDNFREYNEKYGAPSSWTSSYQEIFRDLEYCLLKTNRKDEYLELMKTGKTVKMKW